MNALPTALDDPHENQNDYERKLISRVKEFGWQSTHVFGDDEGDPSFTYSTGFWLTLGRPEIILFDLPSNLAHDVLGQAYRLFSDGTEFQLEKPVAGLLSKESVCFFSVSNDAIAEYLLSSEWFYKGKKFPCNQMVWADPSGRFPWQPGFERQLLRLQPDISENGWPKPR